MTFEQVERALDAGRLEMDTPWGAFVPVRRRGVTRKTAIGQAIPVFMENQVEAIISQAEEQFDWRGYRIVGGA